jgi:hypothetical protein
MLRRDQPLATFVLLLAFCSLFATSAFGQTSPDSFRQALREQAAFNNEDLDRLQQGRIVAKLLPARNNREVGVWGLVRLQVPAEVFLKFTRDNVAQVNNQAILQIGKFSSQPVIDDLQTLTLENRDLDDLKRCTVADCKVKLSAAMIERVHREVDWNAPDYRVQATLVFRQMLLDYVRDYLSRGSAALLAYSGSHGVNVDEELRSLLDGSTYFNQFAPEFTQYLRNFPKPELAGAENYIFWSKIKFGLKPVITITHVVIYPRQPANAPQVLVASKQIYANHYFDSSLAMSAYISLPGTDAARDSYLLYTNRSRADALGGLFSGLKRSLVEHEAMNSMEAILQEQKLKLEGDRAKPAAGQPGADGSDSTSGTRNSWRLKGLYGIGWLLVVICILVGAYWFIRRNLLQRDSGK